MLNEIYDRDDSLTEAVYYDALLYLLGDVYPDLSEDEIELLLEDMLDRLPDQYAEGVLDTISNVGKKIGEGALKFSADNPTLVKIAGTAAGGVIGGPLGARIGGGVGNYLAKAGQKPFLTEAGKTLALIQNPQAQAAVARAALGVGDGTAPLNIDGNTSNIPVATYLRAVMASAQNALKELDEADIIPPATLSESMPFADDIDRQAEWLAERLLA